MTNSEKAAYIRGLMEGMDLDPNAKETKLFNAIVDLLDDLSLSVEEMEDAYDELSGQVDEIDEDLGELEEAGRGGAYPCRLRRLGAPDPGGPGAGSALRGSSGHRAGQ